MTTSLYDRLGRAEGITRLADDMIDAHMKNPAIKARFLPYRDDPERLQTLKGHLIAFLSAGSGGDIEYTGRSMPEAHRGMNISETEYMAAIDDILTILKQHKIDEQSQKDVLAITFSLKDDIVRL